VTTKLISVDNAGDIGIVKDSDPYLLPPNAWTDGNNVRFLNGEISKVLGNTEVQVPTLTDVQFLMPATKWDTGVASKVWVYAGQDHVYYTDDGTTDVKITRQDTGVDDVYTGTTTDRWNGCVNQNVLFINNGVDAPQSWTDTTLENLRWDADDTWDDVGWKTKVLRAHKNFLFALQLDKGDSAGMNPNSVAWGEPAEPWAVPTTWDQSDTSSIAGQIELSSSEGQIIDALSLRDDLIIYKDAATYNLAYAGGQYVWQLRDISRNTGLFSQGAVVEVLGQHVFMSADDILITDGNQIKSIANKKVRNAIFSQIDTTYYAKTFAVPNVLKEEVWFCYPTSNSGYMNKAAVWNWTNSTWSFVDLPDVNYINYGTLYDSEDNANWDEDGESWDSDTSKWNESRFAQVLFKILGAANHSIRMFDVGYTNNGTTYSSFVERTGLKLGDSNTMKRITAIYPKASGPMDVYVGYAMHQNDAYTWEGPFSLTPETDAQIRCRVTGRYHAVRFVFTGDSDHKLLGYDIEYVDTGYGR